MSLADRINQDYIAAYKSHDATRLTVLRLLKTAMTNRLVELKQPGGTLDDQAIMELLLKQAKQRKDSIEQYRQAKRDDLADKEAAELVIIQEYLPAELSPSELQAAIAAAIESTGAKNPQEMGKVMGLIMNQYKGRVDAKKASELIRAALSN